MLCIGTSDTRRLCWIIKQQIEKYSVSLTTLFLVRFRQTCLPGCRECLVLVANCNGARAFVLHHEIMFIW